MSDGQYSATAVTRPVEVPLLGEVGDAVRGDQRLDRLGQVLVDDLGAEVGLVEDLVAQLVDDLALLVEDLVVLEDVLADLGVALLDGLLGPLDGLGDHLGLERARRRAGPCPSPS